MSTLMTRMRFRRGNGVLWRDTGVHVVALPPGPHSRVVVLGGGSAVVWRLLDDLMDLDLAELGALLSEVSEDGPERPVLEDCLAEMLGLGVLARTPVVSP